MAGVRGDELSVLRAGRRGGGGAVGAWLHTGGGWGHRGRQARVEGAASAGARSAWRRVSMPTGPALP